MPLYRECSDKSYAGRVMDVLRIYGVKSPHDLAERLEAYRNDHQKVFRVEVSKVVRFRMCVHATDKAQAIDIARDIICCGRTRYFDEGTFDIQNADTVQEPEATEVKLNDMENAK